jgi:hypothetical protein
LDRGIGVEEIKLYGAEEDNEMIADSTESNFEDLENVIANVRCSTTMLSMIHMIFLSEPWAV